MDITDLILGVPVSLAITGYFISLIIDNLADSYRRCKETDRIEIELQRANVRIIELERQISTLEDEKRKQDEFIRQLMLGGKIND